MYKAIIFDFDLTLADSSKGIVICFKHTLKEFGYPISSDEEIVKTIGLPLTDGFDVLTGITHNPQREQMKDVYVSKANEEMTRNTFLYPDTKKLLTYLHENEIKVGIVSSKLRFRLIESLEHLNCKELVNLIIGLDDVSEPKPSAEGILKASELFGVALDDILYVGDNYIDAQTAENAKVDFCAVTTGTTTKEEFTEYNHKFIVNSLGELLNIIECK